MIKIRALWSGCAGWSVKTEINDRYRRRKYLIRFKKNHSHTINIHSRYIMNYRQNTIANTTVDVYNTVSNIISYECLFMH